MLSVKLEIEITKSATNFQCISLAWEATINHPEMIVTCNLRLRHLQIGINVQVVTSTTRVSYRRIQL